MSNKTLLDYFDQFVEQWKSNLQLDQARWGDTWKHRPREGQEERIFNRFRDYKDQFDNANTPIPWLKITGLAFIGWMREKHPEELITTKEQKE